MKRCYFIPALSLFFFPVLSALAEIQPAALFSDHMVVQRGQDVPIWGTAEAGETVTVELGDHSATAVADEAGKWRAVLPSMVAAEHLEMKISGSVSTELVLVKDVAIGEVWFASGQSNMQWTLSQIRALEDIAAPEEPQIREFVVGRLGILEPQENCNGSWQIAGPETRERMGATSYYFARSLNRELKVPIGIIRSSIGGTAVEPWTSRKAVETEPELAEAANRLWEAYKSYPEKHAQFTTAYRAALEETKRLDQPVTNSDVFAGENSSVSEWLPASIPGEVRLPGFSGNGVVWLRREIEVDSEAKNRWLRLYKVTGFPTVYWNGKLLTETNFENHPGLNSTFNYQISPEMIRGDKNWVTIRIFAPFQLPTIPDGPRLDNLWLGGEWQAVAETSWPVLSTEELADVPELLEPRHHINGLPGSLFNGLVHPVFGYGIKGVIWYQGESNVHRAWQYRKAFPLMIQVESKRCLQPL